MNIILFAVIVLQFSFMVYTDIKNREERESLQLKLMSDSLTEYKDVINDRAEDSPKDDPDPYVSMEEAGVEKIVKATYK